MTESINQECTIHRFRVRYSLDGSTIINSTSYAPLDGADVLVKTKSGMWIQAWFDSEDFTWICGDDLLNLEIDQVTHWMHIPREETPEETKLLDEQARVHRIKEIFWLQELQSKKQ